MDIGYFDEVGEGGAKGWAINLNDHDVPAKIDILIDGEFVGEATADLFREDLLELDIRGGYAGFSFRIPIRYYDGKNHTVDAVNRAVGCSLPDSPRAFAWTIEELPLLKEKAAWAERVVVVKHSPRMKEMAPRVLRAKRLAIMSTYHSAPHFLSYHHDIINSLTAAGYVVHIVHASSDFAPTLGTIESENVFLTLKRNTGYDFGSWAVGVYMDSALLPHLDDLLLLNDSIIGPLTDLTPLMDRIRSAGADVVGLTDSFESCYHLQSYFLWFGRAVCQSSLLQVFMARYSFSSDKSVVIQEGELGLTKFFLDAGFTTRAMIPYEAVAGAWLSAVPELIAGIAALPILEQDAGAESSTGGYKESLRRRVDAIVAQVVEGTPVNPTHFFWDALIMKMGFPFLKREMLFVNPSAVPSYYRIADVMSDAPERIARNISELRRIYGGSKMPFFLPKPERARPAELVAKRVGTINGTLPPHSPLDSPIGISPRHQAIEKVASIR